MSPTPSDAATLVYMTFDSTSNIDEVGGWDGTSAPGGSLAGNLTLTTGLQIFGDFTAGSPQDDVFHVDGWGPSNTPNTRVGFTVAANGGYLIQLGGGGETLSTKVHQHPTNGSDAGNIFTTVTLSINGITIGSQNYNANGGPQTLLWNIAANNSLNNLSSATFDLRFTGNLQPNGANHGPEWSLADGAFIGVTGGVTVVPEPAAGVVALIGLGLALGRRRRS